MTKNPETRMENRIGSSGSIADTREYLESMTRAGEGSRGVARLERSEYFRHPKDFEFFTDSLHESKKNKRPLKFLEIGVGQMEEPISFLAAANSEFGEGENLEDILDLEIVEIRERQEVGERFRLGKQLFAPDKPVEPKKYKDSFVLVDGEYEPNEKIKKYLSGKLDSDNHAHFGTPVENFTRSAEREYDVVACNNVIQHLGGIEGYNSPYKPVSGEKDFFRYYEEISKVLSLVREGGIIFIHAPAPGDKLDTKSQGARAVLDNIPCFRKDFEELSAGIYRKKIKEKPEDKE